MGLTPEGLVKEYIGELVFQIATLKALVDQLQKQVADLTPKDEK